MTARNMVHCRHVVAVRYREVVGDRGVGHDAKEELNRIGVAATPKAGEGTWLVFM